MYNYIEGLLQSHNLALATLASNVIIDNETIPMGRISTNALARVLLAYPPDQRDDVIELMGTSFYTDTVSYSCYSQTTQSSGGNH